jgi:hypothetical protein
MIKIMNNIQDKSVQKKFLDFENNHQVFLKEVSGIRIWKLIRITMYRFVAQDQVQKTKNNHKRRRFNILDYTFNSIFFSYGRCDTIIFENPRKIKNKIGYYDPYTKYYIDEYLSVDSNYQIIDDGYLGNHYEKSNRLRKFNNSFYYDIVLRIRDFFFRKNISLKESSMLDSLEKSFDTEFKVSSNLKKHVINQISVFNFQLKKYGSIYDSKKCKEIYIVCSYGKEGMIHAAKIRSIKVTEFQHGNMGPYQMGYHFPNTHDISYFPDRLLLFGEIWKDITCFPPVEIGMVGYKHLTETLNNYLDIKKQEKSIVVISQPSVSDKLIPFVIKTAEKNLDYTFTYRLHPKEKKIWKEKYPKLVNSSLVNFTVDDSSDDLYELIANAEFVIGVHSTTILECIMLDANVILVDLPGVEHMSFLIEKSFVNLVRYDHLLIIDEIDKLQYTANKNYIYEGFNC